MTVQEYSADEVILMVDGVPIEGGGEDTLVSVEYDEADWEKSYGVRGNVSRSRNLADGGTFTITLKQTDRDDIEYLESIAKTDRETGDNKVPIDIKDTRNGEHIVGKECWLQERPSREFAGEEGEREYIYDVGRIVDVA